MTIIKSLFTIAPLLFLIACGDNTESPVVKDITSIKIDDSNISIYSTDDKTLTATVTYTDGTSESINDADLWVNSNYDVLSMYNGFITPADNNGSSIVSVQVAHFSDEINVTIIGLTDFNISSADINTTGDHILEATGIFEDNTSKIIKRNIEWSATNDAVITTDDDYVTTITIYSGDTNVTATLFDETNTSASILAPITKTYSID